jgi:large subunit ribosomal protein L14e
LSGPRAPARGKLTPSLPLTQVLIDGPETVTGVRRQVINFKWISLTDFKVEINRNARQKGLTAAWKSADTLAKFQASAWGRKVASKVARAATTDFERFEAKVKKQAVMKKVRAAIKA